MTHFVRKVAACLAVAAVLGVAASPAMAERVPGGSGQPVFSGQVTGPGGHGVIHCQAYMEVLEGTEYPAGTYPGVIVLKPSGEFAYSGPTKKECPLTEVFPVSS